MALDIIIGIAVIALFAYSGRMAAYKKICSADAVRGLQEDLKRLKNCTFEKRMPVNEALPALEGEAFSKMHEMMKGDKDMTLRGAWEASGGAGDDFKEENALVSMLLDSLENLRCADQEREFERALSDLRQMEDKKRREGKEKLRLYTSLGALTGLCAVIFLV